MQLDAGIYELLKMSRLGCAQVKAEVERRAAEDVDPEPSEAQQYMRTEMSLAGYKHLLAVGALRILTTLTRRQASACKCNFATACWLSQWSM